MTVTEALKLRRSVHSYDTDRDVSDDQLRELLGTATLAPSSFNLNPWRFIVVRSEEGKRALYEASLNQKHILEAPVVLIVLGKIDAHEDVDLFVEDWIEKGYYPDDSHLRVVSGRFYGANPTIQRDEAIRSTSIMAGMMMLAATERGLGSSAIIGFKPPAVIEHFQIPENHMPVMLMTLGYEKTPPPERVMRLPLDRITMRERFDGESL